MRSHESKRNFRYLTGQTEHAVHHRHREKKYFRNFFLVGPLPVDAQQKFIDVVARVVEKVDSLRTHRAPYRVDAVRACPSFPGHSLCLGENNYRACIFRTVCSWIDALIPCQKDNRTEAIFLRPLGWGFRISILSPPCRRSRPLRSVCRTFYC